MTEKYNLFEFADLQHPGHIEATKGDASNYGDRVNHVGHLEIDPRILKLSSSGLLLLPLKALSPLELRCVEEERPVPADIHMVNINGFPFAYAVDKHDTFALDGREIRLNVGGMVPKGCKVKLFRREERACLEKIGVFKPDEELVPEYLGLRGEIAAHHTTILPGNGDYKFSNIAMRDYFAVGR